MLRVIGILSAMKRWKMAILLTCLIPLLLVVLLYTFHWVGNFLFNKPEQIKFWHEKVQNVFADVKVGLTKEEVLKIANAHNWPKNLVYIRASEIQLHTPFEFPASNWIIVFDFSDGKLIYAKVRSKSSPESYSESYIPQGAPKDIALSRASPE